MDSLASTAIYLASSLTSAQAPRAVPPAAVATVMVAAPNANQDVALKPADAAAIGNPFSLTRARGGKSLSEAIADEVRRDALERPTIDAGTGLPLDLDGGRDESLREDVTAAHDDRIAFIERRMEELRSEGASAAPTLVKLGAKLHMAMAARRLAVAREAIGRLPTDCAADPGSDPCRPAPTPVATNAVTDHRRSMRAQSRQPSASHHATLAATSTHPSSSDKAASRSGAHRAPGRSDREIARRSGSAAHVAAAHVAAAQRGGPHAATGAVDDASAKARRLLAAARHLLEDGTGHGQRPAVKLAGLLQWEGSETWSLADYRKVAA